MNPLPEDRQVLTDELARIMDNEIRRMRTGPARVQLRNYLNVHPDDGRACFLFGLTYHREKRYGEARPWYQKALQLAPEYAVTHHFYGWALYYLGELPAARTEFEAYLATNPDEPDSHFALGLIALDEDDLAHAQQLFRRSIALLEHQGSTDRAALSRAHTRLGEALERDGRLAEARSELEQAATLYPDHYEALYKLYRVLVRLGETQRADEVHAQYQQTLARVRPGSSFPQ